MSIINFETKLIKIGTWTIIRLPKSASIKLPSRGMVFVEGTINGFPFKEGLEPDGKGSHWLKVDENMCRSIKARLGNNVMLSIEPSHAWIEPEMPIDLKKALRLSPKAHDLWKKITPINRWDWIRWLRSTKSPETRKKRVETTVSMLKIGKGKRCCFNRSQCTIIYVSDKGVLLKPTYQKR